MKTYLLLLAGCIAAALGAAEPGRTPPSAELEGTYPFAEVIKATTGRQVLAFDPRLKPHQELLTKLKAAAQTAAASALAARIDKPRANEVGNAIEPHVIAALQAGGLDAARPRTASGRAQATGYPDVFLDDDPPCYLELKTFNATTATSSQRTFYYSPAEESKVTRDALHLLLAFEMEQRTENGVTLWVPVRFKITSLHAVPVQLKIEYNQSNRGLYADEHLLADEVVPGAETKR